MTRNIETWIECRVDESESLVQLEVVPTPKGWSAKIINDERFVLLDSNAEVFMIAEHSTIELVLKKLDRLCAADLNKMMAAA
jgi:hypothetical protein